MFVPLSRDALRRWVAGESYHGDAYSATGGLLDAFGLVSAEDEDTERTLLHVAALAALLRDGVRLVAVAAADATERDSEFGLVECREVSWTSVTALFADDSSAASALAEARRALAGLTLDQAWEDAAHAELMAATDLMWFGPEEWATLV